MNSAQVCDRLKAVLSILDKPLGAASKRSGDDAGWIVQAAQLEIVRDQLLELQSMVKNKVNALEVVCAEFQARVEHVNESSKYYSDEPSNHENYVALWEEMGAVYTHLNFCFQRLVEELGRQGLVRQNLEVWDRPPDGPGSTVLKPISGDDFVLEEPPF